MRCLVGFVSSLDPFMTNLLDLAPSFGAPHSASHTLSPLLLQGPWPASRPLPSPQSWMAAIAVIVAKTMWKEKGRGGPSAGRERTGREGKGGNSVRHTHTHKEREYLRMTYILCLAHRISVVLPHTASCGELFQPRGTALPTGRDVDERPSPCSMSSCVARPWVK